MKNDILKFRKICEILMKEKGYCKTTICKEAGISEPTLQNLLTADLDSFIRDGVAGMRSSTLGKIQDFNKLHRDDLAYSGIGSATKEQINEHLKNTVIGDVTNETLLKTQESLKEQIIQEETEDRVSGVCLVPVIVQPMEKLTNEEIEVAFGRIWNEAMSRGLLVGILQGAGYSGELVKKLVI